MPSPALGPAGQPRRPGPAGEPGLPAPYVRPLPPELFHPLWWQERSGPAPPQPSPQSSQPESSQPEPGQPEPPPQGYPQNELRGKVRACGDIVTPVVLPDAWDAEKGPDQ